MSRSWLYIFARAATLRHRAFLFAFSHCSPSSLQAGRPVASVSAFRAYQLTDYRQLGSVAFVLISGLFVSRISVCSSEFSARSFFRWPCFTSAVTSVGLVADRSLDLRLLLRTFCAPCLTVVFDFCAILPCLPAADLSFMFPPTPIFTVRVAIVTVRWFETVPQ